MNRSLRLKPECIADVKAASRRKFARQIDLADRAEISRATVSKFLKGHPVDRFNFIELAELLDFEVEAIAKLNTDSDVLGAESSSLLHWDRHPQPQTTPDREEELTILRRWIFQESCQVLFVYGFGKIGKTGIISKLYREARKNSDFEGGIWVDFKGGVITVEKLLERIVKTWSDASDILQEERLSDKISKLVDFLETHRYLIVLRRIDKLFQEGEIFGRYQLEYRDYEELFAQLRGRSHKSCWIAIGRQPSYDILGYSGESRSARLFHLKGLNQSEAVSLLHREGIKGSETEMTQLTRVYMGHPWWLQQLSSNINTSTVTQFLTRDLFACNGTWDLLEEHFQILSSLEKSTLYWLAINREPVTSIFLYDEDMAAEVGRKGRLMEALKSLRYCSLVHQQDDRWELPEIVLRFMTTKLIDRFYDGFVNGDVSSLNRYPLIKVTGKEYIREEQIKLVLQRLLDRLKSTFGGLSSVENKIRELLKICRQQLTHQPGYAVGNLFNLLLLIKKQVCTEKQECTEHKPVLQGLDFSGLFVWQADFTAAMLHDVNLSNANLSKSVVLASCDGLLSMSLSRDGKILAAGDTSGKIYVWQVAEGKLEPHLIHQAHSHWVRTVAVSANGAFVASGGEDRFVYVWNVKDDHAFPFRGSHSQRLRAVAFSPGNNHLLASAGDDGHVILWDIRSRRSIARYILPNDKICALAFSSDGKFLVSASEKGQIAVHAIDSTDNYGQFSQPQVFQDDCQGKLQAIALSPDDRILATGGDDGYIRLWNISTGHLIGESELHHTDWIRSIAFSPDGKNIASSGEDFAVKIWDSQTGRYLNTFFGHQGRVWAVVFDSESEYLFSAGDDQTLKTWDVQTGHCWKTIQGYTSKVRSVAFSPDEQQLTTASDDGTVRLWDLASKKYKNLYGHQGRVWSVSFTSDGAYVVSGSDDKTVKVWKVPARKMHTILEQHTSWVRAVACSPKLRLIASGGDDCVIWLHDLENFDYQELDLEHKNWIQALAFGWHEELGKLRLASASDDKTVKIWDIETRKCILSLEEHQEPVRAVALSPDCRWVVSGSNDKTVRLCEIETGRYLAPLGRQEDAHMDWVRAVAFHPDFPDRQLIASASYDRTIKLWDISDLPATCTTLSGHNGAVVSVAFSPDGQTLASGSEDDTIRLWDVDTGECLEVLKPPRPYENMDITNIEGLTTAQKEALVTLGAKDRSHDL
ncbi:pentapeptide repeat-containing protein [Oscillatoriales cyanobacterium LEGE 11467]|uniref:Pentapeptide repeat-containing protein n=1 Tax=Zarconia navalis LEGE 11467 TaxID=1828826 RepID=A0A928W0L1_9CYAN|nr:NB-ARC domain-containing protein [Zarconia navalis]MBE9042693.1 pentapeptide repeat-containing protein [Zarconia navalis LEGE 11467]